MADNPARAHTTRSADEPSSLGPLELAAAGITLGQTYPAPIVDHPFARDRTLAAYQAATEQPANRGVGGGG